MPTDVAIDISIRLITGLRMAVATRVPRAVSCASLRTHLTFPSWQASSCAGSSTLEKTMEFEVQDMTCGGCANAITRAVTAADPGAKLDIDVAAKRVTVESTQPAARVQSIIE